MTSKWITELEDVFNDLLVTMLVWPKTVFVVMLQPWRHYAMAASPFGSSDEPVWLSAPRTFILSSVITHYCVRESRGAKLSTLLSGDIGARITDFSQHIHSEFTGYVGASLVGVLFYAAVVTLCVRRAGWSRRELLVAVHSGLYYVSAMGTVFTLFVRLMNWVSTLHPNARETQLSEVALMFPACVFMIVYIPGAWVASVDNTDKGLPTEGEGGSVAMRVLVLVVIAVSLRILID